MLRLLREEKFLLVALLLAVIVYPLEHSLLEGGKTVAGAVAAVLLAAIIGVSLRVAHHAEILAEKVGEPYGTMILTLAAVLVEVVILAIMMGHNHSPTLARDTIYAAVMLDMNGILGLAALLGGLKHGEQSYNDDSGKTYVTMILTAVGISMVIPELIPAPLWKHYSVFTIGCMVMLYGLFLRMQTGQHSYFFAYNYATHGDPHDTHGEHGNSRQSMALLVAGVVLIGALAEVMSKALDVGLEGSGVPPILPALLVAAISASPEILTALRAALANRMQPVVNIALGASLSTVILTVPVIEALALFRDQPIQMAMTPLQTGMMFITLIVAGFNLHDGKTNAIEGMTHFVLFATFLMLTILGL
ncbi:calcium:proton antiporter [Pseudomonas schmalbachii]|uniref:Calcium:proton antiporter n=1 Tax=Pseudomonas schmalbachii TaxID=2816993 RepID=A0ABS3TUM5_9PSED|nr:calcium:proton antiporter [Pseudomonas schmalbachii]MBO3277376.1 calcium:proton antiporter [Pseudomonas schmalbachii]